MPKTYRITYIGGLLDCSSCPPAIVFSLWPSFEGWPVTLSPSECLVQVPDGTPPPADLGPLVRVQEVPPQA